MDHTILRYLTDDGCTEPYGVLLQIDNGDTQFLTTEEYKTFLINREKLNKKPLTKQELFVKLKEAHQKYVDWWLPIDVAGGSFMAPMCCHRFCETLLVNDGGWYSAESTIENWWNAWLPDFTEPKEKYLMKRFILDMVIGHFTDIIDLNEND